jgi:hyaluronoglucosaminidase
MNLMGVCEGFYGPSWSFEQRAAWAKFLGQQKMNFYLYGPKADHHLRKNWNQVWPASYVNQLRQMVENFHQNKVLTGVMLSPFGLKSLRDEQSRQNLIQKIEILSQLKFDYIGIFFDDMSYSPELLKMQMDVLDLAQQHTRARLIFCPTYYSFDPILDKVFGQRPADYVEEVGKLVHPDIEICWTGPKVISNEISSEHLQEVTQLLRRKPFFFDNFFANDGPKNCKFLKLKDFKGRSDNFQNEVSSLVFNPMNQALFSQVMVLMALKVLTHQASPESAFEKALSETCSPALTHLILQDRDLFLNKGLDQITHEQKTKIISQLYLHEPLAYELQAWLLGEYNVGAECLTD